MYKPLTVYSASAGAGKTFTLAVRFIELLIANPLSYRETLAVTFTNKATEEMKMRIMSQLYGLWQKLPDSNGYLRRICSDLSLPQETVQERAGKALRYILHDYSHFNIETIDAFFQRVLRSLAHELELNANLKVELNDYEVEDIAVDDIIQDLNNNKEVMQWVIDYVRQQMEDDHSWNVIDSIKSFGQKIFSEGYKQHASELNKQLETKDFFTTFYTKIRRMALAREAEQKMKDYGEEFFRMLDAEGISTSDLAGKSNSAASYFEKLRRGDYIEKNNLTLYTKKVLEALNGPDGWVKESSPYYNYAREVLVPYINKVDEERKRIQYEKKSASVILSNLNQLRLLSTIEKKVRELNNEEGRFLLSDTQGFLGELMKEDDAPFVYEKIGGRLENIMIDEFQDTSTVQWNNFHKLLVNTIADAKSQNLIVGDIKQSIYRWREGDWRLLKDIGDDEQIACHGMVRIPLKDNWRSEERVINFNNTFFGKAAQVMTGMLSDEGNRDADIIRQIYDDDMKQNVPEDKRKRTDFQTRGLVDITLLPSNNYEKLTMERTLECVRNLLDKGVKDNDIAIITRENARISQLADYLQQNIPDHRFISDEAFRLDASIALRITINAIRMMVHPEDGLTKAILMRLYQEKILQKPLDLTALPDSLLPTDFISNRQKLMSMPLMDMVQALTDIFSLHSLKDEAAYIYAFNDQLSSFTQNHNADLQTLLDTWDKTLCKKTIKNSELEGISLVTIHKSKGLEFDHVIMPFCSWKLTVKGGGTLWCTTDESPFSDICVVPATTDSLKDTVYNEDYMRERLQYHIDNLNMLYVAFTRAVRTLHVFGQNECSKKKEIGKGRISGFVQETLMALHGVIPDAVDTSNFMNAGEEIHFSYGEFCMKKEKEDKTANVFMMHGSNIDVELLPQNRKMEFRQSNKSRDFVSSETDTTQQHYIEEGTIMHDVLSRISTVDDVDGILQEFMLDGQVSMNNENGKNDDKRMASFLHKRLLENKHTEIAVWFGKDVEVMNECTIVTEDKRLGTCVEKRPDRVIRKDGVTTVIDFKFGNQNNRHHDQVQKYMNLLSEMGEKNVQGFLWYVYQNEIVKI